jgi:hypothetical protein
MQGSYSLRAVDCSGDPSEILLRLCEKLSRKVYRSATLPGEKCLDQIWHITRPTFPSGPASLLSGDRILASRYQHRELLANTMDNGFPVMQRGLTE